MIIHAHNKHSELNADQHKVFELIMTLKAQSPVHESLSKNIVKYHNIQSQIEANSLCMMDAKKYARNFEDQMYNMLIDLTNKKFKKIKADMMQVAQEQFDLESEWEILEDDF